MFERKKSKDSSADVVNVTLLYESKKGQLLVHDQYKEGEGHALLNMLPGPRTMEDYYYDFERGPEIHEEDRNKDRYERYHLVSGLSEFFSARDFGYMIEQQIAQAFEAGYNLSIPKAPGGTGFFTKVHGDTVACSIIGPSGTGKTTTLMFSLEKYPKLIIHEGKDYRMQQVVYIKVDCPPAGSVKAFYDSCISELEKAVGQEIPDREKARAIDAKRFLFTKRAERWNLGMIVIDEIQNLISAKKNVDLINQFLSLSNESRIPIVYVGTDMAADFFKNSEFFIERRIGTNIRTNMFEYGFAFEVFMKNMWKYQWMQEYIPLTEELKNVFYKESSGIVDRIVKLFKLSQQEAILSGLDTKEGFTPAFVKAISSKYFYISRDTLVKLADPKVSGLSIRESDLKNALVANLDEAAEALKIKEECQDHINETIVLSEKEQLKEAKETVLYNIVQHFKYRDEVFTQKEMQNAVNAVFKYKRKVEGSVDEMTKKAIKQLLETKTNIEELIEDVEGTELSPDDLPRFKGVI